MAEHIYKELNEDELKKVIDAVFAENKEELDKAFDNIMIGGGYYFNPEAYKRLDDFTREKLLETKGQKK